MEKTSLEQFKELISSTYPALSRYVFVLEEKKVVLEDYEEYAWGKNPDLSPLFEKPCPLPIKSYDVEFKEKDCVFIITLHLK